MGIFNEFNKKEKPVFTGSRFGFGAGGSTSAGIAGLGDVPSPTMLNSTEEFTGGTEVVTASTLTTS